MKNAERKTKEVISKLMCKHCKAVHEYSSNEVVYGNMTCKSCGKQFRVSGFADQTTNEYTRDKNGCLVKVNPKLHMSKKARRKVRKALE